MNNTYAISVFDEVIRSLNKKITIGSSFDSSLIILSEKIPGEFLTITQDAEELKVTLNFDVKNVMVHTNNDKVELNFHTEQVFTISEVKHIEFERVKFKVLKPIVYNSTKITPKIEYTDKKIFIISAVMFLLSCFISFDLSDKWGPSFYLTALLSVFILFIALASHAELYNEK